MGRDIARAIPPGNHPVSQKTGTSQVFHGPESTIHTQIDNLQCAQPGVQRHKPFYMFFFFFFREYIILDLQTSKMDL